jgi:DNA-binding GntR family transcriptional regulator
MTDGLAPIERTSIREEVYGRLRRAITDGSIEPGAPLVSTELAERLGVSRTPVRDAITRLVQDGLAVDDGPGQVRVRPVVRDEIIGFFQIRAALEAVAASRVATAPGDGWHRRLEEAEKRLERRVAEGADRVEQTELNSRFHQTLYEASGNPLLPRLMADLEALTARRVLNRLYQRADPQATIDDHRALLRAITAGDADTAARVAQAHVERAAQALLGDAPDA